MAELLTQDILIMIMITFMIVIITNYSLFLIAQDILATMERPPDLPPSRSADYCTKKSFFQVIIMIIVDDEDVMANDSSRYFHDDNDDMIIINNCSGIEVD